MKEKEVLKQLTKQIAGRISRRTISALQKISTTLSSEDSGLKNAWDEICVQIQGEESYSWDAYDQTVRSIVVDYVDELKLEEKRALWFQTEQGEDWLYDAEEERDNKPPVFDDDIVQYVLQEYVYAAAGSWSNRKIRAFMDTQYID